MTSSDNIYLFVPNLIGYARIGLAIWSFCLLSTDPLYAMSLYALSCLLDAVDGYAARSLKQSSRFGAVLDMVTDRCSTTCLLVYLAHVNPNWMLAIQLLISLDLSSHYSHMVSSLTLGSSSHKKVGPQTPMLLRLYYQNSVILFLVCAGNELFFMIIYLLGWPGIMSSGWNPFFVGLGVISFPVCAFKQVLNVIQLMGAAKDLVNADMHSRRKGKERIQ